MDPRREKGHVPTYGKGEVKKEGQTDLGSSSSKGPPNRYLLNVWAHSGAQPARCDGPPRGRRPPPSHGVLCLVQQSPEGGRITALDCCMGKSHPSQARVIAFFKILF